MAPHNERFGESEVQYLAGKRKMRAFVASSVSRLPKAVNTLSTSGGQRSGVNEPL